MHWTSSSHSPTFNKNTARQNLPPLHHHFPFQVKLEKVDEALTGKESICFQSLIPSATLTSFAISTRQGETAFLSQSKYSSGAIFIMDSAHNAIRPRYIDNERVCRLIPSPCQHLPNQARMAGILCLKRSSRVDSAPRYHASNFCKLSTGPGLQVLPKKKILAN